jgi:F-type H+-transporting ATPase subunit epsilon
MAEKILFELVSPAKLLSSEAVEMVVVPGAEGDFGAMPRHAPLISAVRPGVIDVYQDGKVSDRIFVAGGFSEVTGDRVTVLAEEAIKVSEITQEMVASHQAQAQAAAETAKTETEKTNAAQKALVAEALRSAAAR